MRSEDVARLSEAGLLEVRAMWKCYKKMAENMAELVACDTKDAERVDGRIGCADCGLPYYEHPQVFESPTFHLICTGRIVKT